MRRTSTATEDVRAGEPRPGATGVEPAPLALRVTVLLLGAVLLVSLGGLVVMHLRPGGLGAAPSSARPGAQRRGPAGSSTTTTSTTAGGSSGPTITALDPPQGSAGRSVTIRGRGLFSANGSIVVTFEGRVALTRCPTEQRCIATVPTAPHGSFVATVRVRTASGLSNALAFRYD